MAFVRELFLAMLLVLGLAAGIALVADAAMDLYVLARRKRP